jgi:WXG100 family type VII secretion target
VRGLPANDSPATSIGTPSPSKPRRSIRRPNAVNANRCRGCPSSSTHCRTGEPPAVMLRSMTDPLNVDPAVLAKEAPNFERIAEELKAQIVRVEATAAELFDSKWKGPAADAAKQALTRYVEAARQHVAELNAISTSLYQAGIRYSEADLEGSRRVAEQMHPNGEDEDKKHGGHIKLVDDIKRRWTGKDLYPRDPTAVDIRQDRIGDCYLDATIGGDSQRQPAMDQRPHPLRRQDREFRRHPVGRPPVEAHRRHSGRHRHRHC